MKILKKLLNIVIAFVLTVIIIINFAIVLISATILNKEYVLACIEKSGYYEKVEIDIRNGFENYKYQSGLSEKVFYNLYSKDMIIEDINKVIEGMYEGTEVSINSEKLRENFQKNMDLYLSEEQMVLTEEQQKNINEFEDILVRSLCKRGWSDF